MQHHDEAIGRYLARTTDRSDVIGVLLTGSLATGTERADSDVDLVLVVTDEAWRAAETADRIMVVEEESAGYAGGYFDVKLATAGHLRASSERGDDPVRNSLGSARVLYDQGLDLRGAIAGIAAGRPGDPSEAVASSVAQARLHGEYFLAHGLKHDDPFLTAHAATHLALAAGRGLLAREGVLYPGPKDLVATLRALSDPGPGFAAAVTAVTRAPSPESARALVDLVEEHLGRVLPAAATLSRFVRDNELAWFTGITVPEHR